MFKGPQEMSIAGNAAATAAAADAAVVKGYSCCKCINLIIWSNFHKFGQISIILVKFT